MFELIGKIIEKPIECFVGLLFFGLMAIFYYFLLGLPFYLFFCGENWATKGFGILLFFAFAVVLIEGVKRERKKAAEEYSQTPEGMEQTRLLQEMELQKQEKIKQEAKAIQEWCDNTCSITSKNS